MPREEKRKLIIEYIKSHPTTTSRELRENLRLHPDQYFNGLKEAFLAAGIQFPRTLERKTQEEKRKIIIDYIRKNPKAGGHTIKKDTKINFQTIFKTTKEAFDAAGVPYDKTRLMSREIRRDQVINLLKKNPYLTLEELKEKTSQGFYKFFDKLEEAYQAAGIDYLRGSDKINYRKRNLVLEFIKNNKKATQREINSACKTHVQLLFDRGIYEAYELAGVTYPYERLKVHGVVLEDIRNRSKNFEDLISSKLRGYGKVSRLVKTKRGVADVILERKGKKIAIEIKDYQSHHISISQIRQLLKYVEDCNCNIGILICSRKPKRDKFFIGKNTLYVIGADELNKISAITDM